MVWHAIFYAATGSQNDPHPAFADFANRNQHRQCGAVFGRWRLAENSLLDCRRMFDVCGDVLMSYQECINEDCYELTENIGGLCAVCMGLAQKRAEEARKAVEKHHRAQKTWRGGRIARFEWRSSPELYKVEQR